jgi:hypothetical protein
MDHFGTPGQVANSRKDMCQRQIPELREQCGSLMNALEIVMGLSISLSSKFQVQSQQALQGLLLWQSCSIRGHNHRP